MLLNTGRELRFLDLLSLFHLRLLRTSCRVGLLLREGLGNSFHSYEKQTTSEIASVLCCLLFAHLHTEWSHLVVRQEVLAGGKWELP